MKDITVLLFVAFLIFAGSFLMKAKAQETKPDTVNAGIYVTSIHDIDFKQKEYTITFWLWLKYKNIDFDFIQNLEIPMAKTVSKSFSTIDTSDGRVYLLMKIQCVMKDSWKIENFPFDRQRLMLSFENSQYDSRSLIFTADTVGKHFDPRFTLRGWTIDSFNIKIANKKYETAFGDESVDTPHTEYSAFRVNIGITRNAAGLFWKMFLGMYVSFFIAYVCFYIHSDNIESRFGLSVGSLFAVIGNKYIIDSALPESTTFTLVDTLHGLTLICIFAVISCTTFSIKLVKREKIILAHQFDMIAAQVVLAFYVILNIYFIWESA
ncbi:MAG: hypothetical protein ABIN36_05130 [Ferruginibacter sp.]